MRLTVPPVRWAVDALSYNDVAVSALLGSWVSTGLVHLLRRDRDRRQAGTSDLVLPQNVKTVRVDAQIRRQ